MSAIHYCGPTGRARPCGGKGGSLTGYWSRVTCDACLGAFDEVDRQEIAVERLRGIADVSRRRLSNLVRHTVPTGPNAGLVTFTRATRR